MMKMSIKSILLKVLKYTTLILWTIVIFLPIITVVFGSFKTYDEFTRTSGITMPSSFSYFENYIRAFVDGKMLIGFINTFILIFFGAIGSVILGSMVAFVISRFDFKFKKIILFMYLFVSIVPMEMSQVATFKIIDAVGIYNTRLAPIIIYLGADVLMVYIYIQALEKIPRDLDKAAMLEGAGYFKIYKKVIFPLLKPATATAIMLKIITIYNDFYVPYLYMPGEGLNTVSTTLFKFIGPASTEWQVICAAIVISMIPMILFFIFLQKHIYEGITSGSIR
ncbi:MULTISPECIES: carbohydrate ABC transporter permease [Clostridium]|uniref:carbohydrate ABC transporter permease n=1 Tax=Clostridium TaxID=1485 RepID=UPI001FADFABD|nr:MULTISPECIES: carbohydrate ABC transporter permease [Clostridium]MCR1951876.1 carbohydrate ABC transporter permease [Clostridium sp. DSM 100503]MDI9216962.1 carbohydrate ABC transporter permease [Clostridium tertium]